jgi:DNA-binding response OmpR family regulator
MKNKIKQHILIIEDEKLIAYDIEKKLNRNGFSSSSAADYEKVKQVIQKETFDLILVDIMLPGEKDGIEIIEELNLTYNIPAIFITAYDEEEIINRLQKTGPYGYILKPFDEKELIVAAHIAIHHHSVEMKLQEKNLWITSILNTITDVIVVVDFEKEITFMNTVAQNIFSKKSKHLDMIMSFFDEDKRPFKSLDIERFKRTNMPIIYHEIFVEYIQQKEMIRANCSFTPLFSAKGKTSGVVISVKKCN